MNRTLLFSVMVVGIITLESQGMEIQRYVSDRSHTDEFDTLLSDTSKQIFQPSGVNKDLDLTHTFLSNLKNKLIEDPYAKEGIALLHTAYQLFWDAPFMASSENNLEENQELARAEMKEKLQHYEMQLKQFEESVASWHTSGNNTLQKEEGIDKIDKYATLINYYSELSSDAHEKALQDTKVYVFLGNEKCWDVKCLENSKGFNQFLQLRKKYIEARKKAYNIT